MEFPYYFIVALKVDDDGQITERRIEQRNDAENANICSGWLKHKQGFSKTFVYGGVPLKWVGGDEIFEIYEPEG